MATPIDIPWTVEEIQNDDTLFMRVHKNLFDPTGEVLPSAFRNHGDPSDSSREPGMSTDWQKYSSAEDCRARVRVVGKDPDNYGVVRLPVGPIRQIPEQRVAHTPIFEPDSVPPSVNRAHTDVFGDKDEEARLTLLQISRIVLSPTSS